MRYFLGIDAGGSRTRARLTNLEGFVLGEAETGPANARIGLEPLHAVLMSATRKAIAAADLHERDLTLIVAGMGIAGISRPGLLQKAAQLEFPFGSVYLESDAAIANLGAHLGEDGATLVLGTGSVAYIKIGKMSLTIGGYGFPISDEGSGAALGLSAMRHALRALDGRTRPTPLSAAVTEKFNHDTGRAIEWMDEATPKDYASFAPLVMDYAERNDEIARSIVEDAVKHVERFIETIFNKGAPRCALAGGLSRRLQPWLRERTAARLTESKGDSLHGALLLARSGYSSDSASG
ncbi:MAG: ATPase [Gammaproteobacteria bacterium]|nr:ATPase [Gammaproteobacteria bacterium]MCY4256107.1 ATPase [Gammaproteobacteria bacterium]MCY4340793.1 ATPase [Gammaproteobacteria bacterium]